jgi:plasmid stabilization system protein ParE
MDGAYEVVITPRAETSLEEILVFLIENVSIETAERVRSKLLKVIYNLSKMPTSNPVARGIISEKGIIYRRALALSYRIVFTINEEQLQVLVLDIHHVRRDPKAINESFE